MSQMVLVKDQFDPELRKLISKKSVAVIPIGSIEQHGPHLPVSTDSDIVTEIAKRVCEKKKFLLLPTLSYGVSFEHAPFFQISLKKNTVKQVLLDLIQSLASNKIKTVFIINGHHGNQNALKEIVKIRSKKIRVFAISYWHFMSEYFDHAGFVETSLMLAISKNVKMSKAKKGFIEPIMSKSEKTKLSRKASESFISVTKNGIWGDPREANTRKGKEILAEIVKNIKKKCQTCLTG